MSSSFIETNCRFDLEGSKRIWSTKQIQPTRTKESSAVKNEKPQLSGREEIYRLDFHDYTIRICRYPSHFMIPIHRDPRPRISLIVLGGVSEFFGESRMRIGPGWAIAKSSRYYHSNCFGHAGATICSIELGTSKPHYERFFQTNQPSCWFLGGMVQSLLRFLELVSKNPSNDRQPGLIAHNILQSLCCENQTNAFTSAPNWLKNNLFEETHTPCDLRIDRFAETLGVVPDHLCRIMQRYFKCTTAQFVQRNRTSHALELLAIEDASISSVAFEAGFTDQAHMTRTFSKHLMMTPGRVKDMFRAFQIA